jgi:hypothetical protein
MVVRWRASWFMRVVPAAMVLVALALPAQAQRASKSRAPHRPLSRCLLTESVRQGLVNPAIVSGKIIVWKAPARTVPIQRSLGGTKEKLALRAVDRKPVVEYERSTPEEEVSIEIVGELRARLARVPKGESPAQTPVEYVQPDQGPVRLVVGSPGNQQTYTAPSLWHLLLTERDVCRQHLAPLVALVSDDWEVVDTSEQIEQTLIERIAPQSPPDRRHWAALVEQLGSERFTQREAADRQLRALGPQATWYLQSVDLKRLDAEQRFRIQRILRGLTSPNREDTADQVAQWLAGDPRAWLILLNHDEESTRRRALEQLTYLLDRSIPFDPTADAQTRKTQREQLRAQGLGN